MTRILLIDDDQGLAPPLREYFARFDLELQAAHHPDEGLRQLREQGADLVILDVMLPDMDGFEVCRTIRHDSDVPIIMLTARGEVTDRVVGLELGADDYLPKPFDPRELVARVQRILKRSTGRTNRDDAPWRFPDLTIDRERQTVAVGGEPVDLTNTEYRLIELLAGRPGHPFSRDEILNALRGVDADFYTRAVDVLVSRVRQKLRPVDYIKTVRGAGYSFVAPRL
ncbi:MAG: response regulator transcription factor [Pseudomonadota bacterium]|nr:response regulator transcription factor [Pseudomonadota bacterium]